MPIVARRTKTGWRPLRCTDLRIAGGEPGHCERCGRNDLRFLHVVSHPDSGKLAVGSECAKRLCHGYDPDRAEGRLRNLWARRSRWLTRNWATSWNGNETLRVASDRGAVRVTVFPGRFGGWSWCVSVEGEPSFPSERYATADAAKLGAFDRVAEILDW